MLGFLKKRRSIVLVLGGGSARGLAHIGVLKVFEKEKIPIHRINFKVIGIAPAKGFSGQQQ